MTEAKVIQTEVAQPLSYTADELRADVRPLRALFEELVIEVRRSLHSKGVADPVLEAMLVMRYEGQRHELSVPFLLEIENAAVCLADPLPLDTQALRQAIAAFHAAHEQRYGYALYDTPVQVVMLRVCGRTTSCPGANSA